MSNPNSYQARPATVRASAVSDGLTTVEREALATRYAREHQSRPADRLAFAAFLKRKRAA